MKAMVLSGICDIRVEGRVQQRQGVPFTSEPLHLQELATPLPGPQEILIEVHACGVCRTELDQIEGRISPPRLPVVLGHQPVGTVASVGLELIGSRLETL